MIDSTITRRIKRLTDAQLAEQLSELGDTALHAWFGNDHAAEAEARQELDLLWREWERRRLGR